MYIMYIIISYYIIYVCIILLIYSKLYIYNLVLCLAVRLATGPSSLLVSCFVLGNHRRGRSRLKISTLKIYLVIYYL